MIGFRMMLSLSLGASCLVSAAPVTFNRDIRPILAKNCFSCHGQDEKKRKAESKERKEFNNSHARWIYGILKHDLRRFNEGKIKKFL